jgi:hypothetical protein
MHTRSKHKDNNNITGEQSLNNKDTHELDHIGDTRHYEQRNKEKQQETTSKICVKEKKEPMKIMQWKMTRRRMTRNDDAKAKEFLEREKEPMKMNAK